MRSSPSRGLRNVHHFSSGGLFVGPSEGGAVGAVDGEAAVSVADEGEPDAVDEAVVASADQAEVGQVGAATVQPVPDVVEIAVVGWAVAAGEDAAAVADGGGPALALGGRAGPIGPARAARWVRS